MNRENSRQPKSFELESKDTHQDDAPDNVTSQRRQAKSLNPDDEKIILTTPNDDKFLSGVSDIDDELSTQVTSNTPNAKLSLGGILLAILSLLISLSFGVWLDGLIQELFARNIWLGWFATALTAGLILTLLSLIFIELKTIMRLKNNTVLKNEIQKIRHNKAPNPARKLVDKLYNATKTQPLTAQGRQSLDDINDDIIDGDALFDLAENALMAPLDAKAKTIIAASAKRVSVVTALSPRALIDTAYVMFEMIRLTRKLSELYGGKPGFLGTIQLLKRIATHLAITGTLSMSDSVLQQMIGHGLASKLSARFGEGLVNGIMTTRIGISAMNILRPMPFSKNKSPKLSDFMAELSKFSGSTGQ